MNYFEAYEQACEQIAMQAYAGFPICVGYVKTNIGVVCVIRKSLSCRCHMWSACHFENSTIATQVASKSLDEDTCHCHA